MNMSYSDSFAETDQLMPHLTMADYWVLSLNDPQISDHVYWN